MDNFTRIIGGLLGLFLLFILTIDYPEVSTAYERALKQNLICALMGGFGLSLFAKWRRTKEEKDFGWKRAVVWSLVGTLVGSLVGRFLFYTTDPSVAFVGGVGFGLFFAALIVPSTTLILRTAGQTGANTAEEASSSDEI